MLELDQLCYQSEYRSTEEITKFRWKQNPETDIVILDGHNLVGYISLLPIHSSLFRKIKNGSFDEIEVEKNVLPWKKWSHYYAYLSSIVINKLHYPQFPGRYLFILLQEHLSKLRKRGIFIQGIIALAVSQGGRRILAKMNFKEHHSNIFIYLSYRQEILFLPMPTPGISFQYSLSQLKVKDVDV